MKRVTKLKVAVVASGRTQKEIAEAAGLNETHFSRIVNGLHCDDATQLAIASTLGREIDELFEVVAA